MKYYWRHISALSFVISTLISCGSGGDEHISAPHTSETVATDQTVSQIKTGGNINAAEFKKEIFDYTSNSQWQYKHEKACVIDFYADWCRPCKMLAPELESAVAATNGAVDLYKVNVDEEKELATFFNIQSIPTMLFCPADGSKPFILQGLVSRDELKNAIGRISVNANKK